MKSIKYFTIILAAIQAGSAWAGEIVAAKTNADLTKVPLDANVWSTAKEEVVSMTMQPMTVPRPKDTLTPEVRVKAVHNGKWIAFQLKWKDTEPSTVGKLGTFSDAVAIQFPVKDQKNPPPIIMGAKDNPVHIIHWRYQYQIDKQKGMPSMKDIYPNKHTDIYPMEFADMGRIEGIDEEKRDVYVHGKAAGNPQSFRNTKGVDEIFAEGFGTSAVVKNIAAEAEGEWKNGEWTVAITRPLQREKGSVLEAGQTSHVAFAVWQGGKDEVGSRKSLTLAWTPLQITP